VIYLLAGLGFALLGADRLYLSRISGTWPTASATIVSSDVQTSQDDTSLKPRVTFSLQIKYQYQVGATTYTGNTFSYDGSETLSSNASQVALAFPTGQRLQIHYDPANPATSVIFAGTQGVMPLAFLAFGLILIAIPVCRWLLAHLTKNRWQN
jgi:hypothetical protein